MARDTDFISPGRLTEQRWAAEARLLEIMDLVVAEWNSDPGSVVCFDLGIVEEAKRLNATRREILKKGPFV